MWAPSLRSIIPSLGLLLLAAIPQAFSKPTPSLAWNVIPANASSHPSVAQYTSSTYGLDAPHVAPINTSAWDWWYFDVVSSDAKTSVIVVFYTAPGTGFIFNQAPPTNLVLATISVGVPGDPQFFQMGSYGTQAKVASTLQGASGSWDGTGFEFIGSPDLSEYTIFINSKDIGVKGQITFKSNAPAHYPCGPVKAGENMQILPNIGWSNAIPGAVGKVNLDVNGTDVSFTGVGYHDKNWGDRAFVESVGSWYWGHGLLGPYTIVWFSALTPSGALHTSAYVSEANKILTAQCSGITVRPAGANTTYPPLATTGTPGGYTVDIAIGGGKTLEVHASADYQSADAPGYFRWSGKLTGGLKGKGQKKYTGSALFEQFALLS